MSGVGEFVTRLGEMIGIILFGILSVIFGIQVSFVIVGIGILAIAIFGLIKRFHLFQKS